jgi:hypothetical protein
MSTPPRSTVQASREQLDELDALLQRMLELPVDPTEDTAPAASNNESTKIPPPAPKDIPSVTTIPSPGGLKRPVQPRGYVDDRGTSRQGSEVPKGEAKKPVARRPAKPVQKPSCTPPATPTPSPVGPTIKIVAPGTGAPAQPAQQPSPTSPEAVAAEAGIAVATVVPATGTPAPLAVWQWPLGWLNLMFDFVASRLGPPGRWARQPTGRRILGWIGVALLVVSLALLILDWIGWPQ